MRARRSQTNALGLLLCGMLGLFVYQNCSQANFSAELPSTEAFLKTSYIDINEGATYTRDAGVRLHLEAPGAGEMYITNDPSCEAGGSWEVFKSDRAWTLGQTNAKAIVYAQFRDKKASQNLGCIKASIIHDNTAPTVDFLMSPGEFAAGGIANYQFRGTDNISGLDYFECLAPAATAWKRCGSSYSFRSLPEGTQEISVRAIDKAGNISSSLPDHFLVDLSQPTVQITSGPPTLSNSSNAVFKFTAQDAGSGIQGTYCTIQKSNQTPTAIANCQSPVSLSDLGTAGATIGYRFTVWAKDRAGNVSDSRSQDFEVNKVPSSAFEVLGLTGGTDTTVDALLGTSLTPTVTWQKSEGAVNYTVAILSGSTVVCPAITISGSLTTAGFPGSCKLQDAKAYNVQMSATNELGNVRAAPLFSFVVDVSGPVIIIADPVQTNDSKDVSYAFSVTDSSGVKSATCIRNIEGAPSSSAVESNCTGQTSIQYKNLALGSHTFQIRAEDNAGNKSTSAIMKFSVVQVVCDPFSSTQDGTCVRGIEGDLFYLTGSQLQNPYSQVDSYISNGTRANIKIYLSDIFVPTRNFTRGFVSKDNQTLRTNDGVTLTEYFALQLRTFLKLNPATDTEGKYQFAVISDDGARVEYKTKADPDYKVLINNDGFRATSMGCDLRGLDFTNATRTAFRIKYFQGPKVQIALTLLWRKMPTDPAQVQDPDCGKVDSAYFFGEADQGEPELTNSGYGALVKRGWRKLDSTNFIVDETM